MDASSSINSTLLKIIKDGVKQFIIGMHPDSLNRIGVLVFPGFNDSPETRILPLSSDEQQLLDFVDNVSTRI